MIGADSVTVRAGGRALLADVSLTLNPGEVLAVVGPNGAGKSTLLRALAGDLAVAAGQVRVEGRALRDWRPIDLARRRAVVSQHVALGFPMRAAEVIALGRLPWHATAQMARDEAAVTLAMEQAGVAHLAERAYATLSGGERQRVQVARALAQLDGAAAPAALLLDEPTASLDAGHRGQLLRLLRRLARQGTAVLAVLHDLNEADFVADRVAMLIDGRLAACGGVAEALDPTLLQRAYGLPFRMVAGGGLLPDFAAGGR
ncbi:heme ABC transporter ATP-binding protein [Roseomonas terrae]|jgi:iron complex transport system ATP-binding protein|uniref:Heme ABC transporter ATP-binding protein n=1 Tax=Neoroseomonas terrae TaxID=424799 RepID=A0ABS5EDR9_9PROT|nr:heme ABC transporter ATP-binding protein [Neoroseomonas terrae]MBR0649115.1 heme ABC transporter ATP-binding protein [Neoroseomonas terrae]